jgi:hypothetical protein
LYCLELGDTIAEGELFDTLRDQPMTDKPEGKRRPYLICSQGLIRPQIWFERRCALQFNPLNVNAGKLKVYYVFE